MILGIGTDITNINRISDTIREHGDRFVTKYFHEKEIASHKLKIEADKYLARRWAAKEALTKAMGTGFRDGIFMKDIAVLNDEMGKPYVELFEGAKKAFVKIIPQGYSAKVHLSISDDFPNVVAFVIIEGVETDGI